MAYVKSALFQMIQDDLAQTEGRRETVKAGILEKAFVRKTSPKRLHVNPNDEFASSEIGPNESIVSNYSAIARRNREFDLDVFDEPIVACKLKAGGYMILNGHHRWAGAMRACAPNVRVRIMDLKER